MAKLLHQSATKCRGESWAETTRKRCSWKLAYCLRRPARHLCGDWSDKSRYFCCADAMHRIVCRKKVQSTPYKQSLSLDADIWNQECTLPAIGSCAMGPIFLMGMLSVKSHAFIHSATNVRCASQSAYHQSPQISMSLDNCYANATQSCAPNICQE
jgi:hypothetical protein